MKASWVLLQMLLVPVLAGCTAARTAVEQPASPAPANTQGASPPTALTPAATVLAADDWLNYDNAQGAYSAQYPPDWIVNESSGANGELITTFTGPGGGPSIMVAVLSGGNDTLQPQDMPNTRCQPVTISGLPGRRCFDTIASSFSTTLLGSGRQYTIATSGHFAQQELYQRFLDHFAVTP